MDLRNQDPVDAEDEAWAVAHQRAMLIRKIIVIEDRARRAAAVRDAAAELGVSQAGVYRMLARFRAAGTTSALLPRRLGRPVGTRSLDTQREGIIAQEIKTFYLRPERPLLSQLIERISQRCNAAGLRRPNWRTVHARVDALDAKLAAAKRHDVRALTDLMPTPGELIAPRPLDIVQIDHTPVDVMVVDVETRQGTTRPWLTLAIDVHTRLVVGYHLSLNEPSVISVGLCLLNAVFDKTAMIADMGLDVAWPTMGLPQAILVDNSAEFRSKAFIRGCEEHGITVDWRPPGAPRYGGHIERLIGTHMNALHVIDGSSVSDRQGRDARPRASLTMRELERRLVLEIAGKYNQKVHVALQRPPVALWRELTGVIPLRLPPDRLKFWVAFLPEKRRQLRRDGIHLFGIRYWSPALAQDVGHAAQPLVVRYDPRDISRVFVRRHNGFFAEARYRHLGYPPVSLWARNAAVRRLRERGRHEVDEAMLFASIAEQRVIEDDTMSVWRLRERYLPVQVCARCRADHARTTVEPVVIKAWFEYWQIECELCALPFSPPGAPNLRRSNPAREEPEWFAEILPFARRGAAQLKTFVRTPLRAWVSPIMVLRLLSMRMSRPVSTELRLTWATRARSGAHHCIAELFLPGLRERLHEHPLVPTLWTEQRPVRLVTARTILFAAMANFMADRRAAYSRTVDAVGWPRRSGVERWLDDLSDHSAKVFHPRSART